MTISFGDNAPALKLPPPDRHPLDRVDANGSPCRLARQPDRRQLPTVAAARGGSGAGTKAGLAGRDRVAAVRCGAGDQPGDGRRRSSPAVAGPGAHAGAGQLGTRDAPLQLAAGDLALTTSRTRPTSSARDRRRRDSSPRAGRCRAAAAGLPTSASCCCSPPGPDLWVNRLADGGAGIPGGARWQPAPTSASQSCSRAIGWAVGFLAAPGHQRLSAAGGPGQRQTRVVSRVEAQLTISACSGAGQLPARSRRPRRAASRQRHTLPEPYSLEPAALVAWPQAAVLERNWIGHLVAPNLRWLPGAAAGRDLREPGLPGAGDPTRRSSEQIVDGELILVVDPRLVERQRGVDGMRVFDDRGASGGQAPIRCRTHGGTAGATGRPPSDPVGWLGIVFPLGQPVGIVGLGGMTVSARDAVAAENALIKAEAVRQAHAASAGPKTDASVNVPHQRAILAPGRLYRLDIDLVWAGELSTQNETGQVQKVTESPVLGLAHGRALCAQGQLAAGAERRNASCSSGPRRSRRTRRSRHGDPLYTLWLLVRQDVFHPGMLQRYLGGYDPGQAEQFRFCDDPLRAHFNQDHVAALARAYGFDLQVAVQRVDRPGPAYANPTFLIPAWTFITDPSFLSEVDRQRYDYAQASACAVPIPGATATVITPLEADALYDIHVVAKSTDPGFSDGALPGVTFTTSHWRRPREMFAGLGLATAGEDTQEVMNGDLQISGTALGPAVLEDDDQAFQNALHALGMGGWPVATAPRVSRFWIAGDAGAWLLAGLMVESPEPIHRAGRLELTGLNREEANGTSSAFDIRRRDRGGARLIYLTTNPQPVTAPGSRLVLSATSNQPGVSYDFTGELAVPEGPDFAQDPR